MNKQERISTAVELKRSGRCNCAQSVACAFADVTSLDEGTMAAVTSAFGTGMGNMEGTCGAIVGAGVILGLIKHDRVASRAALKRIMERFEAQNGAVQCRLLKGIDNGNVLRPCNDCVADAACMLSDELNID